jgi:co-chaperonin GroES (HSP10)
MIKPCNRYILIKPSENEAEKEKTHVLLPDEYIVKEKFKVYEVLDLSRDSKISVSKDEKIIVENSMVEELNIGGNKHYLVLENYVLGVVK